MKNSLKVNEIFYSLAGEGANTGMPVIFIRLSGCNKECPFCDTAHKSGEELSIPIIISRVKALTQDCGMIIFTGGEPLLQLNPEIIEQFLRQGFRIGLETNGTLPISKEAHFDYITVSPKVEALTVKNNFPRGVNEIRYPLAWGDVPPPLHFLPYADRYYVSPLFDGVDKIDRNIEWCVQFCKEHPVWSLSVQLHKILGFA
jgi:organic radical activating enzyme